MILLEATPKEASSYMSQYCLRINNYIFCSFFFKMEPRFYVENQFVIIFGMLDIEITYLNH